MWFTGPLVGSSIYKAKGDTSVPDNNWEPPPSEEDSWDDDSELLITTSHTRIIMFILDVKYVPKTATVLME